MERLAACHSALSAYPLVGYRRTKLQYLLMTTRKSSPVDAGDVDTRSSCSESA